jgi:hypothetical protein
MGDLRVKINPIPEENYSLDNELEIHMSIENCYLMNNGIMYDLTNETERGLALLNVTPNQKKIILELIDSKINKR